MAASMRKTRITVEKPPAKANIFFGKRLIIIKKVVRINRSRIR